MSPWMIPDSSSSGSLPVLLLYNYILPVLHSSVAPGSALYKKAAHLPVHSFSLSLRPQSVNSDWKYCFLSFPVPDFPAPVSLQAPLYHIQRVSSQAPLPALFPRKSLSLSVLLKVRFSKYPAPPQRLQSGSRFRFRFR